MTDQRSSLSRIVQFIAPVAVLAAGIAVLAMAIWLRPDPPQKPEEETIARVETTRIQSFRGNISMDVDGTVVPHREITLTAEVSGRIKFKSDGCFAGRYVKAGTLLMEIDPIDYDLEVRRLAKEVRQAEIGLQQMEIELENTDELVKLAREDMRLQSREVGRLQNLLDDNVVTDSEMDLTRRNEIATRNALQRLFNQVKVLTTQRDATQAALELAATRLEKAEIDLQRTKIAAPVDGMIVSDLVEQDSYVQRGDALMQLEDTSAVEVKCNLRMDQLYWLWLQESDTGSPLDAAISARGYELPKAKATVTYHLAGQDFVWEGELSRFDGIGLDPKTRTVPCLVLVSRPLDVRRSGSPPSESSRRLSSMAGGPPALVRGMFVTVSLNLELSAELGSVPPLALQPGNKIWRVNEGKLQIDDAHVARLLPDAVLLDLAGAAYQIGDRVVISPIATVRDGMPVEVLTAEATAAVSDEQDRTLRKAAL